jgi:two-component system response regulator MprA
MRDNDINTGGADMNLKVLAIDDDHAMTELLTLLLKTHGFNVVTANTGEEGVSLALQETPDVIILDLMMPGMDGWQVCNQIRTFSTVPILVFSALDSPGMVASALDAGADDYLVKPVPSGVLIAHLNKLTRRPGMNNGDKFKTQTAPISL